MSETVARLRERKKRGERILRGKRKHEGGGIPKEKSESWNLGSRLFASCVKGKRGGKEPRRRKRRWRKPESPRKNLGALESHSIAQMVKKFGPKQIHQFSQVETKIVGKFGSEHSDQAPQGSSFLMH